MDEPSQHAATPRVPRQTEVVCPDLGTLKCRACPPSGAAQLLRACAVLCPACQSAAFCSDACMSASGHVRSPLCLEMMAKQATLEEENASVTADGAWSGGFGGEEENGDVGRFWGSGHRSYCRARTGVLFELIKMARCEGNELPSHLALEHALDLLWLSRSDGQGIRNMAAGIMLQLGMVQEALDFLMYWWVDDFVEEEDLGGPFLHVRGTSLFEDPMEIMGKKYSPGLSQVLQLALVKVVLCMEAERFEAFAGGLADEGSPVSGLAKDPDAFRSVRALVLGNRTRALLQHTGALRQQAAALLALARAKNEHVLDLLVNPGNVHDQWPPHYSPGSKEEAVLSIKENLDAWEAHPGAIAFADDLLKNRCAACGRRRGEERPLQLCKACQGNKYCSRECQAEHWPRHKKTCKLWVKERKRKADLAAARAARG